MVEVMLLTLVNATVSFTVTEARIFRPIREHVFSKNKFIKELTMCGYCFGHWVAAFLVFTLNLSLFPHRQRAVDAILTIFVIAWISGIQYFIINKIAS